MTQQELLDIVNEKDEIIGVCEKEEAHKKRLLHRFVHLFIETPEGKLVVQQRSKNKTRGPLKFDAAVGGHVSSGETYEDALIRETSEEIGLTITKNELVYLGRTKDTKDISRTENQIGKLFYVIHDGPFKVNEEVEQLLFFTLDELQELIKNSPEKCCKGFIESVKIYLLFKAKN